MRVDDRLLVDVFKQKTSSVAALVQVAQAASVQVAVMAVAMVVTKSMAIRFKELSLFCCDFLTVSYVHNFLLEETIGYVW